MRVESLRPGLEHRGEGWSVAHWIEHLETSAEDEFVAHDGTVACWRQGKVRYLAAWPTPELIAQVLERAAVDAGLDLHRLPEGLRIRRAGNRIHVFNCSAAAIDLPDSVKGYPVLGQRRLPAAGVTILETG